MTSETTIPIHEMDREDRLFLYSGADRVVTLAEALKLKRGSGGTRLDTGIPDLDKIIDGVRTGELIVISGPTKHGKTTLMETISNHIAHTDCPTQNPPLWFSYEVNVHELAEKYGDAIPDIRVPLELVDKNIDWIEEKVCEAKAKFGSRVVFIDHLHYLADIMMSRDVSRTIGTVMRYLKKNIAEKHEVVVFLAAHITKAKMGAGEELDVSDIRDSSFIAQEANSSWMVRRMKEENTSRVTVCNHRRTGAFNKWVDLVKVGNFLQPLARIEGETTHETKRVRDFFNS